MSHIEKLLKNLEENPKHVSFTDLDKILKYFGFERREPKSGSSHVTYSHPLLTEILTIPKGSKHVKPIYAKKALKFINVLKNNFGSDKNGL